jgi:hypothetical protein
MSRTHTQEKDPEKWFTKGYRKFRKNLGRPETKQEANQRTRRRINYLIRAPRNPDSLGDL